MSKPEYSQMSIEHLVEMQLKIAEAIKNKQNDVIRQTYEEFDQIAKERGITLDQVLGLIPKRRPGPVRGTKLTPKYRDPKTGQTWTGKGKRPRWAVDYIQAGGTLDQLLIK